MSFHVRTAVMCDEELCHEVVVDEDRRALRIAKESGWVRVRRGGVLLDLCPEHKNGGRS